MKTASLRRAVVAALCAAFAAAGSGAEFHVAPNGDDASPGTAARPFRSLERARDAIRDLKRAGPLASPTTVYLRGGRHTLTRPVVFGPEDSGTAAAPITYAAFPGEQPVLDGGRQIAGWRRHDDRLWVADLPAAERGKWNFRQLFVGGQPRPRARTPNEGFLRVAGFPEGTPKTVHYHTDCQSFGFKPGDIRADWTNLTDVEVIVYHFWTDSHLPIQSVDTAAGVVTFAHKAGKVFTDDFSEDGARYIVENVFEGLDAPGEWYLNRRTGRLYYYPMPGEAMERTDVVAPAASGFLHLRGDLAARRFVEHLRFQDLTFVHTRFELPAGNSNDKQGSASVPAAIILEAARACRFEHCRLTQLGTFGFELLGGCSENDFMGNEIGHVAAGGFRLNGGTDRNPPWERTHSNRITDNWLHHYGLDFPSAVGVLLMHADNNVVAHNRIHDGGYTGISAGWVWGYHRSVSQHNRIEFNHIHDLGRGGLLSDMGGIYTLGVSPGTVIRHNHIHDVTANRYGGWGIYLDEGSTHLLVENNVVHHTKFAPFNIHYAKEVTVRNNIFALGRLEQVSRTRNEPHKSVYFENNIVYWREGELLSKNWKDVPYTFHAHPKDPRGTTQVTSTFECDWNLYFNPAKSRDEVKWAKETWSAWQQRGKDVHSRYADPLFVDPDRGDFTLQPDSPALELGFKPIDIRSAGPRVQPGPRGAVKRSIGQAVKR